MVGDSGSRTAVAAAGRQRPMTRSFYITCGIMVIFVAAVFMAGCITMATSDSMSSPVPTSTPTPVPTQDAAVSPPANSSNDLYVAAVKWPTYSNGSTLYLLYNKGARDPTYDQLMSFLLNDTTTASHYFYINSTNDMYACLHFSRDLLDNASKAGIKAKMAVIGNDEERYAPGYSGHAMVLFHVTNNPRNMAIIKTQNQLIYIDPTGYYKGQIPDDKPYLTHPMIAYPIIGEKLHWVPIVDTHGIVPADGMVVRSIYLAS